ncbi:glycosyltransferase [Gallibacterium sp. AGMB14963]|uniref:glycosyltransferase n=1 Tax=Gallibacterium faecale TaxID=3019086 RepID=UPI0022F1C431|nr:glycosyltransferase [Gallibacterium sp. AGMB14963]MDA3978219.1 glycosyltransferase [Gallibacterium sp. AGMB14963]
MKKVIFIGAGGYAKSALDSLDKTKFDFCGFIDRFKSTGDKHLGFPILANEVKQLKNKHEYCYYHKHEVLKRENKIYLLIDPFYEKNRGVSSYIESVSMYLQKMNFSYMLFKRHESETIEQFRLRLLNFYLENEKIFCCIEAPETLAATLLLPVSAPVHIRIHFSKIIGDYIQGKMLDCGIYNDEQKVISNSRWISAPSQIAIDTTKKFYSLPPNIYLYPHPIYLFHENTFSKENKTRIIDVLFIGRWEKLKGIYFLKRIVAFLAENKLTLGVLSDKRAATFCKKTESIFFDGVKSNKYEIIQNAKVIIIPSLFETVSMVGLEALYFNKPIVTWAHLGISEYAKEPWVYTVQYPDIMLFCEKIKHVLKSFRKEKYSTSIINDSFFKGLTSILSDTFYSSISLEVYKKDFYTIDIERLLKMIKNTGNNEDFFDRWQRKWRKFFREPTLFFKDAIENKFKKENSGKTSEVTNINTEKTSNFNQNLGHIPMDGKITFKEPESKPIGMVTALFYPRQMDKKQISDLLEAMNKFQDFTYIGKERLHICTFNAEIKDSGVKIFERITPTSRLNLSRLSNIILLDAPQNLVTAIRACSPNNRLIYVDTKGSQIKGVDSYISVGENKYSKEYPREILIENFSDLSIAIRRTVQEHSPKSPDILLPIIGCSYAMREDFLNFNSNRNQGIIWIKKFKVSPFTTMSQYYEQFVKHIVHFAMLESVYLNYKNWCEDIEDEKSAKKLIQQCLEDGVVFDVRQIEN